MRVITEAEYMKIHPDYRGRWTPATAAIHNSPELAGKRNMLDDGGGSGLITDGFDLEIVPDPVKSEIVGKYLVTGNDFAALAVNMKDPKDAHGFEPQPLMEGVHGGFGVIAFDRAVGWALENSERAGSE